jgi:hypothetical protein
MGTGGFANRKVDRDVVFSGGGRGGDTMGEGRVPMYAMQMKYVPGYSY